MSNERDKTTTCYACGFTGDSAAVYGHCCRCDGENDMGMTPHAALPKWDGREIKPGVFLMGEPIPQPEVGKGEYRSLARVDGVVCMIRFEIKVEIHEEATTREEEG